MNDKEELIKVGKYNLEFNDILGINIDELETGLRCRTRETADKENYQ